VEKYLNSASKNTSQNFFSWDKIFVDQCYHFPNTNQLPISKESTYSILQYTDVLNALCIHYTTATNYFHTPCHTENINMLKRLSKIPTGNTAQVWLLFSVIATFTLMTTTQSSLKKFLLYTQTSRAGNQSKFFSKANHGIYTQMMVAVEFTCQN